MATKKRKKNRAANARRIATMPGLYTLEPADVLVPNAKMNTRFPFIAGDGTANIFRASHLKNVCRSSSVSPTCYVGQKKMTGKKLGLNRPSLDEYKAACKRAGGAVKAGYDKAIRADKVELDLLSPAQAKHFKTLPGPNLRLCVRDDNAGYIIPVSDPVEARRIHQDFAACTKGDKTRMAACALKLARATLKVKNPPLGRITGIGTGGLLGGMFTRGR